MQRRLIVVPLIRRADGRYLFIKMPLHRGVFPGQWGLPGGGVEEGERIEEGVLATSNAPTASHSGPLRSSP